MVFLLEWKKVKVYWRHVENVLLIHDKLGERENLLKRIEGIFVYVYNDNVSTLRTTLESSNDARHYSPYEYL